MTMSGHPTRLRPRQWFVAAAGTVTAMMIATSLGAVGISPTAAAAVLIDQLPGVTISHGLSPTMTAIIMEVRLPRVMLAAMVGAVLAGAGSAYQATFHNPLADPYLLGVASGAGLGVTMVLTVGQFSLGHTGPVITAAAFLGALVAVGLTYGLGSAAGGRSGPSLILAGVAVAALFASLQTLLLQRDDEAIREVYAWLLGRLNTAGWTQVLLLLPLAAVSIGVLIASARQLDVLALGDDEAQSLGVHPRRLRLVVVVAATLATAAAVSVSGLIAFVGIIVPHAIRLRVGPSYRQILPLSIFLGAAFLCLADLGARTVIAPAEIPIGVITAIAGAPFFLVVLRLSRHGWL